MGQCTLVIWRGVSCSHLVQRWRLPQKPEVRSPELPRLSRQGQALSLLENVVGRVAELSKHQRTETSLCAKNDDRCAERPGRCVGVVWSGVVLCGVVQCGAV